MFSTVRACARVYDVCPHDFLHHFLRNNCPAFADCVRNGSASYELRDLGQVSCTFLMSVSPHIKGGYIILQDFFEGYLKKRCESI